MLIALAGLQATGKSTLARLLQEELRERSTDPAIVLDKDSVRACLFAEHVDYSSVQNDLCVAIMYQVSAYHLSKNAASYIILDGRTYSKTAQIEALKEAALKLQTPLKIIECVCSEKSTKERLSKDAGKHLAKDRDFELYLRIKAGLEQIKEPKLVLDTDKLSPEESVRRILDYLKA
jgi:adenylylsulfate kinase